MVGSEKQTDHGVAVWIRWTARIWGGLVFMVAMLVFVGYGSTWIATGRADPHAVEEYAPIENVPPVLMFLAALGSAVAWRSEGLGGAITVACQVACLPVLLVHWPISEGFPRYLVAPYGVWMIIAIPGILFLASWWRSRGLRPSGSGV